jgi:tRNA(Ile)-lysidine synthetase-like protein
MHYILLYIVPILLLIFFIIKKKTINSFQYLLERPKNYYFGLENIDLIDVNHPLVKAIDSYYRENKMTNAIISLSGGVDSMVILAILIKLSKLNNNFPIYTCSINYNQRKEQSHEFEFLEKYCQHHNVIFYLKEVNGYSRKKETSGPRNEFEEESRKVRFELYHYVINKHNCNGVFVGHHKDDIIENIFTNSMKGGNLLDIEVMKKKSNIHGVNIYRPILDYHKDIIYEFAHEYNIPYFLDTTPKWSRRGQMRNEIFPLLDKVFTKSWRLKLKDLGNQSNQWNDYINNYVIKPWIDEIYFGKYGFILPMKNQPKLIYSNLLLFCMHKISKHMLKHSSIEKLLEKINDKVILLDSGLAYYIIDNHLIIFDFNTLQKKLLNESINITKEPIYPNEHQIISFLNGKLSYKQPKNVINNYTINNKRYNQMNIDINLNLIKSFEFKTYSSYKETMWINLI